MKYFKILLLPVLFLTSFIGVHADDVVPSVNPKMVVDLPTGPQEGTEYTGSAPIVAHFTANPANVGAYTPSYKWTISRENKEEVIRRDENMDFTFTKATTYTIKLNTIFTLGDQTIEYESTFSVTPMESVLNVPNAFTPNGDGYNDEFKVKDGYRSIVKFHGYIFNRWGKKLFEWTDITKGWDGKSGGSDVADGAYFVYIEATGADGHKYQIKKTINLLRKYIEK